MAGNQLEEYQRYHQSYPFNIIRNNIKLNLRTAGLLQMIDGFMGSISQTDLPRPKTGTGKFRPVVSSP